MKPSKCKICEHEHWGLAHIFATNGKPDATNTGRVREKVARERAAPVEKAVTVAPEAVTTKTKNRRSKEAYNAYQREYMRKKRSK